MTDLSATKTEEASKARNAQTLSENWLKDPIKSKYAGKQNTTSNTSDRNSNLKEYESMILILIFIRRS